MMVISTAYAQVYPLFDPGITTAPSAILDTKNFELVTELANTMKEAMPGIFVANQCYKECNQKTLKLGSYILILGPLIELLEALEPPNPIF